MEIPKPVSNHKLIFLGEMRSGKTSIHNRYVHGIFRQDMEPTIASTFNAKTQELDSHIVKLEFWDVAGSEQFRSLTPIYVRGANVVIVVFDITNKKSFDKVDMWLEEVKSADFKCVKALVGNKIDLDDKRAVLYEEAESYATENGFSYYEVSA